MSRLPEQYASLSRRWAGEFVVIVLGILVALAVDNWSDDRKDRALEREYFSRIKEDLEWDMKEIEEAKRAWILQARAATTLLYLLDDPLAESFPTFTDSISAIDFAVALHEEMDVELGRLVWWVQRNRTFNPRRGTYDELLATGRITVVDDSVLRAAIIDHYSLIEDSAPELPGLGAEQASESYAELVKKSGFNPFDYRYLDDPLPLLRDLGELPVFLRDVRRTSLRQVFIIETLERNGRELIQRIGAYAQ